jgi:hypothetical protein
MQIASGEKLPLAPAPTAPKTIQESFIDIQSHKLAEAYMKRRKHGNLDSSKKL